MAVALWGIIFFWQWRSHRVQRHIDAGIEAAAHFQGLRAEREWRMAVRQDPGSAEAWQLLGGYYLSTNEQANALDAYRHLLRLRPHAADVEGRLAGCSLHTGDEVSALKYALAALKIDPNNVEALTVAAPLLGGMNDEKHRLEYLRRLVRLQPDSIESLVSLAEALSDNRLYAENKIFLAHLLQLDPQNAQAYALRGEISFLTDPSPQGLAQSKADFDHALQYNPTNAFARLYLGRIYKRQGEPAKAILPLREAARLMPNKPEVYFELAGAYDQLGQATKAAAARQRFAVLRHEADLVSGLEERCTVDPSNFSQHLQAGLMTLQEGDYRRASFYLYAADALRPGDPQVKSALRQLDALRQKLAAQGS